MTALSIPKRNAALFTLALGGLAIGVTEFASMGVLPNIAEDLLPGFAEHPAQEISRAGMLISLYALGVVVGAPLITAFAARASQTTLAFWLLGVFIVGSVASALAPNFELLAVARFLSGLPHATFLGVAVLLAGRLMGPGNQGKGIAIAMSGLPIANIIGVPLATYVGQLMGWRWAYGIVAALFAVALVLALFLLPRAPGDPALGVRSSLVGFKNIRVWMMIAVASIGFAGFFAVYSYLAEVVTRVADMPASAIPWALATMGIGMTLGTFAGGWGADRNGPRTLIASFLALIAALALYVFLAETRAGLFITVFLVGFFFSTMNPAIQARFIRIARDTELMGAAASHASFNIGNALGAYAGGLVIAAGFGYLAPGLVAIALTAGGLVFALISLGLTRRNRSKDIDTTGIRTIPSEDPPRTR